MATAKARKQRDTTLDHIDRNSPAYRVLYGVFGGPAQFSRATGIGVTTCHEWLYHGFVPPRRQAHILAAAKARGIKFDPMLMLPEPKLDFPLPA